MTDQPAAIVAATVSCKTMADSSLRITLDVDPGDAKQAFNLFGERGTTVAIAVLTPEAAKADMQERVAKQAKPEHLYSDFATHLFKKGFFNIPRLRECLQMSVNDSQDEVKERLKQVMSTRAHYQFDSLADIPPDLIKEWSAERKIVFTFLKSE